MNIAFIGILCLILSLIFVYNTHKKNSIIDEENKEIEFKNRELINKQQEIENNIKCKELELTNISNKIENKYNEYEHAYNSLENQKDISKKALEHYLDILSTVYQEKEQEHQVLCDNLENAYAKQQEKLMRESDEIQKDLDKIKATRAAAIEASKKEQEIKENSAFYCLKIKDSELNDIHTLERIKPQLNQPRILSMLIWSTYYQKPMTALCNNIIGIQTKCGIYKITNQLNQMCYIGQAVDLATRWKQHAKCGLGIDTPANNKLYKAMQEDGLNVFSWEVLEECPREQLNEKEKYYIELYQAYEFGYNSNSGVSRS